MNSFTAAQRATHHCDSPDAACLLSSHLLLEETQCLSHFGHQYPIASIQTEALLFPWRPTVSFDLSGTAPVQYGTDTISLPGYGHYEGVVLPVAHPYSLRTAWTVMGVGCHVKPGSERIPVYSEESPPGERGLPQAPSAQRTFCPPRCRRSRQLRGRAQESAIHCQRRFGFDLNAVHATAPLPNL